MTELPSWARLERCPVCRARLSPNHEATAPCRRCAASLEDVILCGVNAWKWQRKAQEALAHNQPLAAWRAAKQAVLYVNSPETQATLAAAWLARHNSATQENP